MCLVRLAVREVNAEMPSIRQRIQIDEVSFCIFHTLSLEC